MGYQERRSKVVDEWYYIKDGYKLIKVQRLADGLKYSKIFSRDIRKNRAILKGLDLRDKDGN